jgi:hypothetical protein
VSEHTTEDTINRLKSLTEKLSLVQDRITIDHAVIEIQNAIAEAVELRAERDDARWRLCKVLGDIRDVWGDEIAIEKGWKFDE